MPQLLVNVACRAAVLWSCGTDACWFLGNRSRRWGDFELLRAGILRCGTRALGKERLRIPWDQKSEWGPILGGLVARPAGTFVDHAWACQDIPDDSLKFYLLIGTTVSFRSLSSGYRMVVVLAACGEILSRIGYLELLGRHAQLPIVLEEGSALDGWLGFVLCPLDLLESLRLCIAEIALLRRGYLDAEPLPCQSIREEAREEFSERREPVHRSSPVASVSL
ncbi:hypothetical protein CRG98_037756 [Punica granatum]|uniref:Uncharacterized protein n=1 Tax=Punica granatum TaxID=22663 RepID=A0A2I0ICY9_PUNGR|nr:hypothetical protein CRG98_037756 [Punica granatum]